MLLIQSLILAHRMAVRLLLSPLSSHGCLLMLTRRSALQPPGPCCAKQTPSVDASDGLYSSWWCNAPARGGDWPSHTKGYMLPAKSGSHCR
jgi:hypothetical protein